MTGTATAAVRSQRQEHKVSRCTEVDEPDHLQYLFSNITGINKLEELGIFLYFCFEHLVCCQVREFKMFYDSEESCMD